MYLESVDLEKYVTCPLSVEDVERLEGAAGRAVTPGLRRFLHTVGIPQNVVPSMIQDEGVFVRRQSLHAEGFVFAVREPDVEAWQTGEVLLFEAGEGRILEVEGAHRRLAYRSFDDFIADSIAEPADRSRLGWAVQLCFESRSDDSVRETLRDRLQVEFGAWESTPMTYSTARCATRGQPSLTRFECEGTTTYCLNRSVAPDDMRTFKEHIAAWRASDLGFTLCNHGILRRRGGDDDWIVRVVL